MEDFAYINNSVILVYLIFSIQCIKRICKFTQQQQQMHIHKMFLSLTVRSPNVLSTVAINSNVTYRNISTPKNLLKCVNNFSFVFLYIYIYIYIYMYELLLIVEHFLTPWRRVLLEKLTGFQLVKKFPAFHGTRKFITAFTSARHLSLS